MSWDEAFADTCEGIDSSPAMLARARANVTAAGVDLDMTHPHTESWSATGIC